MGDERSLTFLGPSFGSTKRNSISKNSVDFFFIWCKDAFYYVGSTLCLKKVVGVVFLLLCMIQCHNSSSPTTL